MFASKEGTKEYMEKAISQSYIHPQHFNEVEELFLSSMGLGTYLGNPTPEVDQQVEDAVTKCLRSGAVNVIDTAINYRFQRAEQSIGKALKSLFNSGEFSRDQIFISTKNGYIAPNQEKYYNNIPEYLYEEIIHSNICRKEDVAGGIHCMSPSFLKFQLYESLSNLQLEAVDLIYLHNPAESQLEYINQIEFNDKLKEVFLFYEKMRDIKKIRWYGLATWDSFRVPNQPHYLSLERVVNIAKEIGGEDHGFKFVQTPINYLYHQAVSLRNQNISNEKYTLAESAKKFGIKLFGSAPMLQGKLLQDEHYPQFSPNYSQAQSSIHYARSAHENIASTLVGMKTPAHITENIALAKIPLATTEELEQAFRNAK